MHAAYLGCNRQELLTKEFRAATAAMSNQMVKTLSVVANDPLPELQANVSKPQGQFWHFTRNWIYEIMIIV
ncbi:hypothetical protein Hanom_Chr03g00178741 [Helianthus anomalus]